MKSKGLKLRVSRIAPVWATDITPNRKGRDAGFLNIKNPKNRNSEVIFIIIC